MRRTMIGLAVLSLAAVACSDEDRDSLEDTADSVVDDVEEAARPPLDEAATDAAELVARNVAAEQGEEQFADAGHPLDDDGLACDAAVGDGLDSVEVTCTGTTQDGAARRLTGSDERAARCVGDRAGGRVHRHGRRCRGVHDGGSRRVTPASRTVAA